MYNAKQTKLQGNENNEKIKIEINLYQSTNMIFGEIANDGEYRIDEQLKNLPIFGFSIVFEIKKNSENLYFPSCNIIEIC